MPIFIPLKPIQTGNILKIAVRIARNSTFFDKFKCLTSSNIVNKINVQVNINTNIGKKSP